mmetsp:Transcript_51577/g.92768  ORF Transcript_51577/g.92768 Transcript_51577/m.92768 type:complete len:216 (+) Transcript_51577:87-734(+)
MPKGWYHSLVVVPLSEVGHHAFADRAEFLFPEKELALLRPGGFGRCSVKTCFGAVQDADLNAQADAASRSAADEADRAAKNPDPEDVARQEQALPKDAIPSRKDCPEILCEKCPECPSCPTCPSCPHGFRHPEPHEGPPPPPAGKVVCNKMENNCPFCPACQCPDCVKKCPPCLKRVPNDPPTVKLSEDGEVTSTDGSPINPLMQAINDDVKAHA